MLDLKEFLNTKDIEKTKLYQKLKCSKNEALILKELCKNYVVSVSSINTFALLSGIFKQEKYAYLDALEDLKKLLERGFITQSLNFLKSSRVGKISNSRLNLLQSDISLSEYFLDFLEDKPKLKLNKKDPYENFLEYLKDEFYKIELYEKLSFIKLNSYNLELKNQIKEF
ncbi:AAA family ATPase, partial [Campylobacter novaezeelandiae]|nr:AAA family ATPase [Campylobacter novaezeelandiae]